MCGIVAIFGDINLKCEQVFKQMLIMDSVRGLDSTGVAVIHRDDEITLVKELGHPFYLLESDRFDKAMRGPIKGLIGHNRAATTGRVLRKNAHPFETENLVGVHNGTITIKSDIKGAHKYDTDSEALFNSIDVDGVDCVENILGAWSLVWYDKQQDEVHLLRNKERPMCYAFSKDNKTLFLASEMWIILAACGRNGVEVGTVYSTEEDVHYTYDLPTSFQAFKDPATEVVQGKKKPTVTVTQVSSVVGPPKVIGTNKETEKGLIGRTGEAVLEPGQRYVVKGLQVFHRASSEESGKAIWYTLLQPVSNFIKCAPLYIYMDTPEQAQQFMEGEWEIMISRAVINNGFVIRYVVANNPETFLVCKKEGLTEEDIKKHRCCNCNSKVELSENWTKTHQGILCAECSTDENVLELIAQM